MAIGIQNMANTAAPTTDFPSGRIKDDSGIGDGTPINVQTNGDIQEFFAKLLRAQSITPSGIPDNEYSGNQTYQALIDAMNTNIGSDIILGLIGPYTTNDVIILWGSFTNPSFFNYQLTEGAAYYNGKIYKFVPYSAGTPGYIYLQIDNSDEPGKIKVGPTSGIAQYGDASIKYLPGITSYTNYSGVTTLIPPIQKKIVEIGLWNMDTTDSVSIPHGIDVVNAKFKITGWNVIIYPDSGGTTISNLEQTNGNGAGNTWPAGSGGTVTPNNLNFVLSRTIGGLFDNANYDSLSANRGIIYIEYML